MLVLKIVGNLNKNQFHKPRKMLIIYTHEFSLTSFLVFWETNCKR